MPNFCVNTIILKGHKEYLDQFRKTLDKEAEEEPTVFSFHQTVPIPESEKSNWYTWNPKNWGTKWDACSPEIIENTDTSITIQCDTAWTPPIPWAKSVGKMYPKLYITVAYCEYGCGFYGYIEIKNESYFVGKGTVFDDVVDDQEDFGSTMDLIISDSLLDKFVKKYQIRSLGG